MATLLVTSLLMLLHGPAAFTVVNGTGAALQDLMVRPADGHGTARTLGPGRLSPGARGAVPAIGGEDCAFDISAKGGGADLRWTAVNLCDVRTVVLNRRPDGTLWVDYE